MLLYNITVGIDTDIESEWLQWMKTVHVPAVMGTGMFVDSRLYKVLQDENEGTVSYSVQYFSESIDNVQQYLEVYGPKLIEQHRQRYLNKHVAFQTLLEEV